MAFVDVAGIVRPDLDPMATWGGHVDLPQEGMTAEGQRLEVAGWVIGRRSPVAELTVTWRGGVLVQAAPNALRPDLTDGFPHVPDAQRGGFRLEVPMPPVGQADLEVSAILEDGSTVGLGVLTLRRRWRESSDPALRRLVSVVIPCFNQGHFLPEALDSVLAQTYPDVEVLVVDDGSTDNTAAVAARYPDVRYVRQDNAGVAAARNTGLRLTNGDLLVFLDADDMLLPDALAEGVHALRDHPEAAFVFGYAALMMEDGSDAPPAHRPTFADDYYPRLLAGCPIESGSSVMFRRSLFGVVGVFDTGVRHLEDYDLYFRAARQFPLHCHGRVVTVYRRHGANATSGSGRTALHDALTVHARQHRAARTDPALSEAYRRGRRFWAEHLGMLVAREVQDDLHRGRWRDATRGMASLLRWWPRGLLTVMRSPRRLTPMPEWRPER